MITISKANAENYGEVIELVQQLLAELGGTNSEPVGVNINTVLSLMSSGNHVFNAFIAKNDSRESVGVITVVEVFAIYAGGSYGIINEMYVVPQYRSQNVGKQLIDAVKALAHEKGWARVDVTAPPEKKWERSAKFYETNGFIFTGPKLKFLVK